ncbi:MAG: zinc-dependent metalloprotease [Luminiphilus sp.]|nr:zinc-dependent metalloprotease [Luminiphilus sp.]
MARTLVTLLAVFLLFVSGAAAKEPLDLETLLSGTVSMPGFLPLYWHAAEGTIYADIGSLESPLIYYTGLSQGVGSNDLGLDRGRLGDTHLVQFERVGRKVLLKALNTRYLARSDRAAERAAVQEAFATSVLWGFEVLAAAEGQLIIDLTDFVQRDAMGLGRWLKAQREGAYRVDASRSVVHMPRTRGFPDNTEIDAQLTYTGDPEGKHLATVTPDATAVTVHSHHSFVRLPDAGYEPIAYDPRAGFIEDGEATLVYDYASPIEALIKSAYVRRHRLKKVNPEAPVSPAVEPIIYYVDPGVPEPIRSALIEGASWWNQAFEAAGYEDAFQVRLLPEGADPMDVRYNVIQWVHRSTRGWSYGASIRDPRTEEIIKGHVTLGSLRVRQDYLIAEGLLAPYDEDPETDALKAFALARIRQLSAHEVGHTLGLAHNFAASAQNRSSVMDYPHPQVTLNDAGHIDLGDAYGVGIGEWDKRAILWGYQDFPEGTDADAGRADIVAKTLAAGFEFVADEHARGGQRAEAGPAHPLGSLWDNGDDPVAELNRVMTVRTAALTQFSERVIQTGEPVAYLEDALVPTYLMHRYQVQAAATKLGGQHFTYALRGDGQRPSAPVAANEQREALTALLNTLSAKSLLLPPELILAIAPRPPQSGVSRELFPRETGYVFDPIAATATAAQLTIAELLDSRRAARLNNQVMVASDLPVFSEVLEQAQARLWAEEGDGAPGAIQRRVQVIWVTTLSGLLSNESAAAQVRADAIAALINISTQAKRQTRARASGWRAHGLLIERLVSDAVGGDGRLEVRPVKVPPGSPI